MTAIVAGHCGSTQSKPVGKPNVPGDSRYNSVD